MGRTPQGSKKLQFILDQFPDNFIENKECSDLGCNVGGFTRELLSRNAKLVHAIDSGYGTLDWDLRKDQRVDVRERQNALFQNNLSQQNVIVSDVAWTRQEKIVPAAFKYLDQEGCFFSLLKPEYEDFMKAKGERKLLSETESKERAINVAQLLNFPDSHRLNLCQSPIKGGRGSTEFWLIFSPKTQNNLPLQGEVPL